MKIELKQTTAAKIASAIVSGRRQIGSTSQGMVLTLVVVAEQRGHRAAVESALGASREHPSRVIVVVPSKSQHSGLDAEISFGEDVPGELIELHMHGEVAEHPTSVVLPLLLSDSPVVVWWPAESPAHLGEDPIGSLGTRRITDASGHKFPIEALKSRAANHMRGDTDLAWTRLTPWRALLAAAVDQYPAHILHATVEGARDNAAASLLAAWLEDRLEVPVKSKNTRGPGITAVRLTTAAGDIAVTREDGSLANYVVPGQPQRSVALRRREVSGLLAEELRRMDYDDIFEQAASKLTERANRNPASPKKSGTKKGNPKKSAGSTKTVDVKAGGKQAQERLAEAIVDNTPDPSRAQAEAKQAEAAVPISPIRAGLSDQTD